MATLALNFDIDIQDQVRSVLRVDGPVWSRMTVVEQMALLAPFVRAQIARDSVRKQAA